MGLHASLVPRFSCELVLRLQGKPGNEYALGFARGYTGGFARGLHWFARVCTGLHSLHGFAQVCIVYTGLHWFA